MYSRAPSTRRSPASVGFSSIPFVSGRSNETAVAPVYRLRPPKSLYAFQVLVARTRRQPERRGPARPQHEPRGRRIRVTLPGAVQPHQVHPARPVRIGRDRHRHRPPAAVLDDRRRDLPGHAGDPLRPPHDLGWSAVAHHLDIDRPRRRGVQRDRITGEAALRPAVARRLHGSSQARRASEPGEQHQRAQMSVRRAVGDRIPGTQRTHRRETRWDWFGRRWHSWSGCCSPRPAPWWPCSRSRC